MSEPGITTIIFFCLFCNITNTLLKPKKSDASLPPILMVTRNLTSVIDLIEEPLFGQHIIGNLAGETIVDDHTISLL